MEWNIMSYIRAWRRRAGQTDGVMCVTELDPNPYLHSVNGLGSTKVTECKCGRLVSGSESSDFKINLNSNVLNFVAADSASFFPCIRGLNVVPPFLQVSGSIRTFTMTSAPQHPDFGREFATAALPIASYRTCLTNPPWSMVCTWGECVCDLVE